jgi:glycerophosphoryl diester phosphodiesterase
MPLIALPPIIGHRCARAFAPENTLAGLTRAAALRDAWINDAPLHDAAANQDAFRTQWVEVDVRLTADGVPVLLHDATLERTTNGYGAIAEMTWARACRLDAGRYFGAAFADEPVPSLGAFLRAAIGHGIGVNLELKATAEEATALAAAALEVAQALWQPAAAGAGTPPPLISSFSSAALEVSARLAPDWPRGLLLDELRPGWLTEARRVGAAAIIVNHQALTADDVVTELGADDRLVLAYTVNDPARALCLRHWGVAAVITDRPDTEMAMAMAAKIRLAGKNFLYGSMVTSCGGRGHNEQHEATGAALSVAGSMIGRVP